MFVAKISIRISDKTHPKACLYLPVSKCFDNNFTSTRRSRSKPRDVSVFFSSPVRPNASTQRIIINMITKGFMNIDMHFILFVKYAQPRTEEDRSRKQNKGRKRKAMC